MPILGLQQTQTEVGRIRLGALAKTATGKTYPTKLDRLRFTSARRELIDQIAKKYGGETRPWQPPKGNAQWEVITDATAVPVMVPPQDPAQSQWYEMWSKGGCQRRCDGQREILGKQDCLCDPEARACSMHTRIRVMLADIPGLGVWRVDTGSYYAAAELPGIAALLMQAGGIIPGRLILDQRTVTRDGQTKQFVVPVLDVADYTPTELISGRVPELAAERMAAAIDGRKRAAIASTVDYRALAMAANTVAALEQLHAQAVEADAWNDDLKAVFTQRRTEIESEVIEGEIA